MTKKATAPAKKAKPKTQEIPELKNVHEAINQVMGRVGYVQKEESDKLKYTFASEPAFIRAVRPHLVDVGLVVYQSGVKMLERNEFTSTRGAQGINILFAFEWTWVHVTSETSITVTSIGEGTDYGDKAANKAMTAAMKYNMRQTLVLETGDDPDYTPSDEFERAKKREEEERKRGKKTSRVENQWEDNVIQAIVDVGLANAREHAVNRLNPSIFMTVPYGELTTVDGVAYMLAWEYSQEKYPDDKTPARAARVDVGFTKFMSQARELLGLGDPA